MNQTNSDGADRDMPVVFVYGCFDWMRDMFFAGIELCGALILGAVAVGGVAYGLYRAGFI